MPTYARDTDVSIDRSRAEIEHTLERFGATEFISGWDKASNVAIVGFRLRGRRMRFRLELPDPELPEFVYKKVNQSAYREKRSQADAHKAWQQACKERWRALSLLIKAKLAAVEAGVVALEDEFLASVMLPDQRTVGEWLGPMIDRAIAAGEIPPLLPGQGETSGALKLLEGEDK